MNTMAKEASVVRNTVTRKAPAVKVLAAEKGVAKNVDGVASRTVATKGVPVKDAKAPARCMPTGGMPPPETLPTSEALSVLAEMVLSGPPEYWQETCADLMKRDRIPRKIIPTCGPARLASHDDPFVILACSIVGQQISVKAAQSVWERVVTVCPKLVPVRFLRADQEKLAGCGLPKRKAEYILGLADRFRNDTMHVAKWTEMENQDMIAELTQIRDIGRWTAGVFLMFNLTRPNVLPLDDIGLINVVSQNYLSGEPVTYNEARGVVANQEPWRTMAT